MSLETEDTEGSRSDHKEEEENKTEPEERTEYQAVSAYLADPELTKYRSTYFKRLELEYPELRNCQQREMQRALLAVGMNENFREEVRDRAVRYRRQREQRE